MIDIKTGEIIEFVDEEIEKLQKKVAEKYGYDLIDHKLAFRGVKSGYGNVIILQHGDNITTLYAHMSSFNSALKVGQRVKQNQVIGYVGSSGLATAPHLHYEYRIDDTHKNPRTVELPQAKPIQDEYKEDFLVQSKSIINQLIHYKESRLLTVSSNN